MSKTPLITITSDFGVQSQGVGIMEAVAFTIAPHAKVIHLAHGLPEFDIVSGAWTMEGLVYIPVGCHVCVVDPGVGTNRKPIVCRVERGDYLIGPNNGVLLPAAKILGGLRSVHEIINAKYMKQPVSDIFHGRDIFVPAAAHLACGLDVKELGPLLQNSELVVAPYEEASASNGTLSAQVININRFGSVRLNIRHEQWDLLGFSLSDTVSLKMIEHEIKLTLTHTFGDVPRREFNSKDDYGRMTIAKNKGSFISQYPLKTGEICKVILLK